MLPYFPLVTKGFLPLFANASEPHSHLLHVIISVAVMQEMLLKFSTAVVCVRESMPFYCFPKTKIPPICWETVQFSSLVHMRSEGKISLKVGWSQGDADYFRFSRVIINAGRIGREK